MQDTVLDCSSVDTALTSLSRLLGTSEGELFLDLSRLEINFNHPTLAPEDQVVRAFGYEHKNDLPAPTAIRWFHATRAPLGTTFQAGILPTLAALPTLWESLDIVAAQWTPPDVWAEYQRSFNRGDRRVVG